MRWTAIILASVISVELFLAAMVQADPQQDADFVEELSTYGFTPAALHRPNWQMVIYIAEALCGDMKVPGAHPNEMVAKMHGSWPNLTTDDIQVFFSHSILNYCPDVSKKQLPWICAEMPRSAGC
jgi:Protein of unknown function (DUF732)